MTVAMLVILTTANENGQMRIANLNVTWSYPEYLINPKQAEITNDGRKKIQPYAHWARYKQNQNLHKDPRWNLHWQRAQVNAKMTYSSGNYLQNGRTASTVNEKLNENKNKNKNNNKIK